MAQNFERRISLPVEDKLLRCAIESVKNLLEGRLVSCSELIIISLYTQHFLDNSAFFAKNNTTSNTQLLTHFQLTQGIFFFAARLNTTT